MVLIEVPPLMRPMLKVVRGVAGALDAHDLRSQQDQGVDGAGRAEIAPTVAAGACAVMR